MVGILEVVRLTTRTTSGRNELDRCASPALRHGGNCHATAICVSLPSWPSDRAFGATAQTGERAFVPGHGRDAARTPRPATGSCGAARSNGWGYSPLEQINKRNVAKLDAGLDARARRRASRSRRRSSTTASCTCRTAATTCRRSTRSPASCSGSTSARSRKACSGGTNRNLAIWGTTLIDAGADNSMYAIDARTGKLVWETPVLEPTLPARASSGPIIANGKVITGRQCQPAATHESCVITAHDAATGKELWRTRTIPRKGEPGDETLGRRADGAALARRHVDGAELRPRARSHLHRHVGHDSGAEVHLGRRRQAAPLSQLDAGAEPGRRQDRLVLPASERPLGSRSSVRAAARRHGRRARSRARSRGSTRACGPASGAAS